jgi:hypothetical protein
LHYADVHLQHTFSTTFLQLIFEAKTKKYFIKKVLIRAAEYCFATGFVLKIFVSAQWREFLRNLGQQKP